MKAVRFLLIGMLFGIGLTKAEIVSWFRIQEMFRFDSFHMYGVIGVAVVIGALGVQIMKHLKVRTVDQMPIKWKVIDLEGRKQFLGGTLFGLGWAMTGACPGPLYALVGHGFFIVLVIIASAILGALAQGALSSKLPR